MGGSLAAGPALERHDRVAIGAEQAQGGQAQAAERAVKGGQQAMLGQIPRAQGNPQRRDETLRLDQTVERGLCGGFTVGLLALPVVAAGSRVARARAMPQDIEIEIRALAEQNEGQRDAHDDGAPTARVVHHRGQPAAQAIGPRRNHRHHAQSQGQQQQHLRPMRDSQAEGQAHHQGHREHNAQGEMGYEVIDHEQLAQDGGQVHQFLQINRLGALEFGQQAGQPNKQEKQRDDQPDQHNDLRLLVLCKPAAEQAADERTHCQHAGDKDGHDGNHRAQAAAAGRLVAHQPPAQPENGLELVPVHSSQLNFCASVPSRPTTARNLSSSEPSRCSSSMVP